MQVREVVHFKVEMERLKASVAMDERQVHDVGVLAAEDAGHRAERAGDVAKDHGEPRRAAVRTLAPGKVEPIRVNSACERVAANDVDLDLLVLAAEADDCGRPESGGSIGRDGRQRRASGP